MSRRDLNACAALVMLALLLAGPRRTRPLAGALYGLTLSRAQGASRDAHSRRVGETIGQLFSEKTSVGVRVDRIERALRHQCGVSLDAEDAT